MSVSALSDQAVLSGRHVVVTRPAAQAQGLASAIRAHGGTAVLFPVLAIANVAQPQALLALAAHIDDFELAVFVSPNAVDKALGVIRTQRDWPGHVAVATMGKSSERALQRFGIDNVIAPRERFDSEALLALPALAPARVRGKRIVIFRGDGGRDLLGQTLSARGAVVEYVTCYHRSRPDLNPAPLLDLWARHALDAMTVTSSEGLRNLFDMVGPAGQTWLRETPTFLPHERIAEEARRLGLQRVIPTAPGDEGVIAGLLEYFSGAHAVQS